MLRAVFLHQGADKPGILYGKRADHYSVGSYVQKVLNVLLGADTAADLYRDRSALYELRYDSKLPLCGILCAVEVDQVQLPGAVRRIGAVALQGRKLVFGLLGIVSLEKSDDLAANEIDCRNYHVLHPQKVLQQPCADGT